MVQFWTKLRLRSPAPFQAEHWCDTRSDVAMKFMKIKSRKAELYMISVSTIKGLRPIYVTKKQLAKLNALPVGKEIFLSRCYCLLRGDFHVLRTKSGLQYMPNPYRQRDDEGLAFLFEA
jgi:hypothetical protein